jgi:putative aldouronate transport system substrate-binding protein
MKVRKKTAVMWLAVMMAMTIALTGCSDAGSGSTKSTADPATKSSETESGATGWNATGFPIVNEPTSLRVFGCKDANHTPWKDIVIFKEYEKMTNMQMKYEETPQQGCAEKKNLLFASNELPDIFLRAGLTNTDLALHGMQEKVLVPLEDLIDAHAPNLKKLFEEYPDARQSVTAPDGHIYALPMMRVLGSERSEKIWINETWLKKLNLEKPANPDELKTVLRAFRDQDPNGNGKQDEIALGLRDMGMVFNVFTGSWGLDKQLGYNINIENDKVDIWVEDDRFKEVLMFLNEMYEEKILWADFYKRDIPNWRSNLSQALFGMFFIQASDPFVNVQDQFTGMAPIVGPHGDQQHSAASPVGSPNGTFAITNANKHPEASIRWVDYFYGEQGSLFARFGVEGQTYTMQGGKAVLNDSVLNDSRGLMAAMGEINLVPGGGFPHLITEQSGGPTNNEKVRELQSYIEDYIPDQILGAPIFDKETSETILPIKADIDKFVEESAAKFILGELSFDTWDDYVKTLNQMGIDQLEEAYQKAYDASK